MPSCVVVDAMPRPSNDTTSSSTMGAVAIPPWSSICLADDENTELLAPGSESLAAQCTITAQHMTAVPTVGSNECGPQFGILPDHTAPTLELLRLSWSDWLAHANNHA